MAFATMISDLEERVNVERMKTYRRGRAKQSLKKYDLAGMLSFFPGNRSWGLLISQLFFHRRNAAVVLEHQLCCEMI